jgi:hypothetical protein
LGGLVVSYYVLLVDQSIVFTDYIIVILLLYLRCIFKTGCGQAVVDKQHLKMMMIVRDHTKNG